jgi:uncharacterized membrane protein
VAFDAAGHPLRDDLRGRALTSEGTGPARRDWLDWTRGLAVVLMVLAHVVDAWTRDADRDRASYYWTTFLGGLAAPAFLFLAGLGTALSGASQRRRGRPLAEVRASLIRRGLTIFGLAFAFRLQAFILGLGRPVDLLKVDVLNVMGPAIVLAALLWSVVDDERGRVWAAVVATAALAFVAPLVRTAGWIDGLPAPLQWYLRPTPGHNNFTLLPWAAFVTAGLGVGVAVAGARHESDERRLQLRLATLALLGAGAAYWASLQPSIYPPGRSSFWGASPTFFGIRLGIVVFLLPFCWSLRRAMPVALGRGLATLGGASLFIYWVHIELVYGGPAILLKRLFPFEVALVATLAVAWAMTRLVPWARRWVAAPAGRPEPVRQLVAKLL